MENTFLDQPAVRPDPALARARAIVAATLAQGALDLEIGRDFACFRQIAASAGRLVTPIFDDRLGEPGEGVWIAARRGGRLVHLQALRCDRVAPDLAGHLADWLVPLYRRAGQPIRPHPAGLSRVPATREISGRVVYQGEFWVASGAAAGVSGRLSAALGWLGQLEAVRRWAPDHLYAFMTARKVQNGLAARGGYNRSGPGALIWESTPDGDPAVEWIVWNSAADVAARAALIAAGSDLDGRPPNPAPPAR